jgi:hypothetical protein
MNLKGLLQKYGERRKLTLTFQDGIARIVMGDNALLNFEPAIDGQGFFLYANLGSVADGDQTVFYEALSANVFGKETGKASLGYVKENHLLLLFQYFEETTTEPGYFEEQLDFFYRYYHYWVKKLEKIHSQISEPPPLSNYLKGLEEGGKMKIFFA